jgi:NodT family efflux transporter outer membrane factor (OMF) lipoprotein
VRGHWAHWRAISLLVVLTGCIRQPEITGLYGEPESAIETAVDCSGLSQAPWPSNWWELYEDPQLNCLIEWAIQTHPNILRAQGAMLQALAAKGTARADLFPEIDLGSTVYRWEYSLNGPFGSAINPTVPTAAGAAAFSGFPHLFTDYDLFTTTTWTLDIWGKYRHLVAAADGEVMARQAELGYAQVTLAISVALAYFQTQAILRRLEVANQLLCAQQMLTNLVSARVEHGLDTQLQVDAQVQQLAAIQEQQTQIQLALETTLHGLESLIGCWDLQVDLVQLDPDRLPLPESLPLDWLGHRLDLMAHRARVEAAAHTIKAARADYYPNVDLLGVFGLDSITLNKWLSSDSYHMQWGAAVNLPVFDFGRRRSRVEGREADYIVAVQDYNGTLLQAVQQVLDSISKVRRTGEVLVEAASQRQAARNLYELTEQRVNRGLDTQLQLVEATSSYLQVEDHYLVAQLQRLEAQMALVQAVGGGAGGYGD